MIKYRLRGWAGELTTSIAGVFYGKKKGAPEVSPFLALPLREGGWHAWNSMHASPRSNN